MDQEKNAPSLYHTLIISRFQRRCLCSSQPIASDTKLRRYLGKLTDELSALEKQAATEMPKQKDVLRMRDISPTVRLVSELRTAVGLRIASLSHVQAGWVGLS